MNRDNLAQHLQKIIGHYRFIRLQSKLKYELNFRKYYSFNNKFLNLKGETLVYMADGRTSHGGFSDRLRGIFSLFDYCQKQGVDFKIHFVHPFCLENFLVPNEYDWHIDAEDLSYNSKQTAFRFINSYSCLTEELQNRFLKVKKKNVQLHVYSNWTNHEEKFSSYFNKLFKFSPLLESKLSAYLADIGCQYISVSFRLISLLGDFKDSYFAEELSTEQEKEMYIQKCMDCVNCLHEQYPQYKKVLVTTDSGILLRRDPLCLCNKR